MNYYNTEEFHLFEKISYKNAKNNIVKLGTEKIYNVI